MANIVWYVMVGIKTVGKFRIHGELVGENLEKLFYHLIQIS